MRQELLDTHARSQENHATTHAMLSRLLKQTEATTGGQEYNADRTDGFKALKVDKEEAQEGSEDISAVRGLPRLPISRSSFASRTSSLVHTSTAPSVHEHPQGASQKQSARWRSVPIHDSSSVIDTSDCGKNAGVLLQADVGVMENLSDDAFSTSPILKMSPSTSDRRNDRQQGPPRRSIPAVPIQPSSSSPLSSTANQISAPPSLRCPR